MITAKIKKKGHRDLNVKISTNPSEQLWTAARTSCELRIKETENNLIIEKAFLEMCNQKLKELDL